MLRYTATAQWDGYWWLVQCDQHPSALSQAKSLDRAADIHREAIAFVIDAPENTIEVTVTPSGSAYNQE